MLLRVSHPSAQGAAAFPRGRLLAGARALRVNPLDEQYCYIWSACLLSQCVRVYKRPCPHASPSPGGQPRECDPVPGWPWAPRTRPHSTGGPPPLPARANPALTYAGGLGACPRNLRSKGNKRRRKRRTRPYPPGGPCLALRSVDPPLAPLRCSLQAHGYVPVVCGYFNLLQIAPSGPLAAPKLAIPTAS